MSKLCEEIERLCAKSGVTLWRLIHKKHSDVEPDDWWYWCGHATRVDEIFILAGQIIEEEG